MSRKEGVIARLAKLEGLARAPLFRPGEVAAPDNHELLLDGPYGSFAVTDGGAVEADEASSWVWSSNVPHHVLIGNDEVTVTRWDRPSARERFNTDRVIEQPGSFYEYLRRDRVAHERSIVAHSLDLFRTLRNLVHHAGFEDALSVPAYLGFLGEILDPNEASRDGVLASLPGNPLDGIKERFGTLPMADATLTAFPALALRHASGAIFQEAHHELVAGGAPDLFSYVPQAGGKPRRGAVHFTPPSLARSLAEQALGRIGDIAGRASLTLMDITCGSGAFLVEGLRALERLGYAGDVILVGRDTSAVAVEMARFVLRFAADEWPGPGRYRIDVHVEDTLRNGDLPTADVVLMNPPFGAWDSMAKAERDLVRDIVGPVGRGRMDVSMAFVVRALDRLNPEGTLATIVPANLIEAKTASGWRERVTDGRDVSLVALFDDLRIFEHATVRVGAFVLSPRSDAPSISLRAPTGPDATGDALRDLRRSTDSNGQTVDGAICVGPASGRSGDWLRTAREARPLTALASAAGLTTVGRLFDVVQGIRTGFNPAFVLSQSKWASLPEAERSFFRAAVTTKGIFEGRLRSYFYVFHPYGEGMSFADADAVRDALPVYWSRHLAPHAERLAGRRGMRNRWWALSWPRAGLTAARPPLVSKYCAGPGGFVMTDEIGTLVLQGFGWVPKAPLAGMLDGRWSSDIASAYLALFNSKTFFDLVAEHSFLVSGGQYDMSPRYMDKVPLPDLARLPTPMRGAVPALAAFARARYAGEAGVASIDARRVEEIARALFGLGEATVLLDHPEPPLGGAPAWLTPVVEAGMEDLHRRDRVQILMRMQGLARAGETAEVDAALAALPVANAAETTLITFLRGTYAFRKRLRGWVGFRDRVAEELARRDAPVSEILVGLYE